MTAPAISSTWGNTIVNPEAAQRITQHNAEAAAAGFAPSTPLFAIGTVLAEVGKDAYRQSRIEYAGMPTVAEALPALVEQIQQEHRIDLDVEPKQLQMLEDGRLAIDSPLIGDPLYLTPQAFQQLARWITDPRKISNPGRYFADIEPARRAQYMNDELHRATKPFKLRTRTPNGHTEVFATTSTRYTPVDTDVIAHTLLKHVDPATKVDVLYQGTRAKVDLIYHSPVEADHVGVGEFYRASQTFRTNDDGTSSIRSSTSLFRALCINLTTIELAQDIFRQRHVGDVNRILQVLGESIGIGAKPLQFFLQAWGYKRTQDVRVLAALPDFETPRRIVEHVFGREQKQWAIPGVTPEQVGVQVERAWLAEEPDWSVIGLSNAMSRAAHEGVWSDFSIEESLQDRAGQLVLAKSVPWGYTSASTED